MNFFEDYLRDVHAKEYTGTDDDMPDNFEHWLCNLDGDEYLEHGNKALEKLELTLIAIKEQEKRNP